MVIQKVQCVNDCMLKKDSLRIVAVTVLTFAVPAFVLESPSSIIH